MLLQVKCSPGHWQPLPNTASVTEFSHLLSLE